MSACGSEVWFGNSQTIHQRRHSAAIGAVILTSSQPSKSLIEITKRQLSPERTRVTLPEPLGGFQANVRWFAFGCVAEKRSKRSSPLPRPAA